jgi:phytanoyl-CoA hydroxylase
MGVWELEMPPPSRILPHSHTSTLPYSPKMGLTAEQQRQYEEQGYLVFPRLFSRSEVAAWLQRLEDLVLERRPRPAAIRLQVESALQGGDTAVGPLQSLRKVEELVANDDVFLSLAKDPRLLEPISALLGPDLKLFRDALMMKPARHGSAKPYHQDSAYWAIDPPDLCSAWIALDDATLENGCMRVLPGSHRRGTLEHRHLADFQVDEEGLDRSGEVAVPLEAGGVLLFHSLLLHATSPNHSDQARRAMICSYMSARSRYTRDPATKPDFPLLQGRSDEGAV